MKPQKFEADTLALYRMTSDHESQLVMIEIDGSMLYYSDFDHGHTLEIASIIEETADSMRFKVKKAPHVWRGEIRLKLDQI